MSFRFLHAADLHLDSPLRGLARYEGAPVDEIRGATRQALKNLVRLATEERVRFVVISGDLYDGDWKDFNTGLFLVGRLQELARAGIAVYAIKGNHDAASRISRSLTLPDNVTLFSHRRPQTVVIDEHRVALHGMSFARPSIEEDLSAGYPEALAAHFNIGLLHTSADGRPGHARYAPCTLDGLKSRGYDYWALGHVHQREILHRDPWVVFPGNLQGRHARETGSKGATLVTVEDGQVSEVEHCPLDVVRWHRLELDLTGCDHPRDLLATVDEQLQQLRADAEDRLMAVRLEARGACGAHHELQGSLERWTNEIRAQAGPRVWLEKIRLSSSPTVSPSELAERDDAFAGLMKSIEELGRDGESLASIGARLFTGLEQKLPGEVKEGDDGLRPTDPELVRRLLPEVSRLLAARLGDRPSEAR